ncbi:hypothetical protein JMA_41990 (plasmid) [Jeotgalibacillus malaysiensis]|uniref:Uncharacterized protein n=1 Tax=Jeotgalibacillus malaysiensis TaxID=1508404 RepID=A0A0B5ATW4_9BACL|nr:hypothetical protein [Jeotgalibacillus malaysiensis]AJD93516.1 hypothetical protein JMA_41990 [Jeotgalibacillus malaysiensis]
MHMKYFQSIAQMEKHYVEILSQFDEKRKHGLSLLESWNIFPKDKEDIIEEREALRYLVGCQIGVVREQNAVKPKVEVIERCLTRHIYFLESTFGLTDENVNKSTDIISKKEFKACRHYLFKLSLPAWYEALPAEILTFENKHLHRVKKERA